MTASSSDFKSNAIFEKIQEEMNKVCTIISFFLYVPTFCPFLQNGADYVKKIKGVFCFKVKNGKGEQGIWIVDAKNGNGSVKFVNDG